MIPTINAISFTKQIDTDGHSPLFIECDDGHNYYCKYRNSVKQQEVQLLVYEMIGTALLTEAGIYCPEQSLVHIPSAIISKNVRYARYYQNCTAWGSKEIPSASLLSELDLINDKRSFNKLENPEDILRIAIFDLWVENADRHSGNYNMLLQGYNQKIKLIPIDHGSIFGGIKAMGSFSEATPVSTYKKLITSNFYNSVARFITPAKQRKIAQNFVTLLSQIQTGKVIDDIFEAIPKTWDINPKLKERISAFLNSEKRMQSLSDQVLNLIPLKKKK